jgi:hypothetical protein
LPFILRRNILSPSVVVNFVPFKPVCQAEEGIEALGFNPSTAKQQLNACLNK